MAVPPGRFLARDREGLRSLRPRATLLAPVRGERASGSPVQMRQLIRMCPKFPSG
jgi:hypothetical protein